MENDDKILQVSNSNLPLPIPIPAYVSSVSVSNPSQNTGQHFDFDFEFLVNIIKGLENTIMILNKRLEEYENASANASVHETSELNMSLHVKSQTLHINSVHEKKSGTNVLLGLSVLNLPTADTPQVKTQSTVHEKKDDFNVLEITEFNFEKAVHERK